MANVIHLRNRAFLAVCVAVVLLMPGRTSAQSLTALYHFYNSSNYDHLYTIGYGEGSGWSYQGVACYVYDADGTDTIPIYRYFNASSNHHLLTNAYGELGGGGGGWEYEGIAFHVLSTQVLGSVPLHRWYLTISGNHYYTTSTTSVQNAIYEGVLGYVSPS